VATCLARGFWASVVTALPTSTNSEPSHTILLREHPGSAGGHSLGINRVPLPLLIVRVLWYSFSLDRHVRTHHQRASRHHPPRLRPCTVPRMPPSTPTRLTEMDTSDPQIGLRRDYSRSSPTCRFAGDWSWFGLRCFTATGGGHSAPRLDAASSCEFVASPRPGNEQPLHRPIPCSSAWPSCCIVNHRSVLHRYPATTAGGQAT